MYMKTILSVNVLVCECNILTIYYFMINSLICNKCAPPEGQTIYTIVLGGKYFQ